MQANEVVCFLKFIWKHQLKHSRFGDMESRSVILDVCKSLIPLDIQKWTVENEISFRMDYYQYEVNQKTALSIRDKIKVVVENAIKEQLEEVVTDEQRIEPVKSSLETFSKLEPNGGLPVLIYDAVRYVEWIVDRRNKISEFISKHWRYSFSMSQNFFYWFLTIIQLLARSLIIPLLNCVRKSSTLRMNSSLRLKISKLECLQNLQE